MFMLRFLGLNEGEVVLQTVFIFVEPLLIPDAKGNCLGL